MAQSMTTTDFRRRSLLSALLLCLLGFVPGQAAAQTAAPPGPGDFSFAVWTGYAATKVDCANCAEGATYGDTWQLGLSPMWRINNKMLAGVEVVLHPTQGENNARISWLLGTVQFHPWATKGFFLKGGYGLLWLRTDLQIDGENQHGKFRGMVVNYGAGWQFRQNRRVSFAPFGAHYVSTAGTVNVGEFEAVNVVGNSWVAGVSVVIR
jgi:hypothetical protein